MFAKMMKSVATAAIVSTSLLGASASAALWTFTTAGTITYGYDYAGLFGTTQDLTGMNYVLSTIVDPEAYAYKYSYLGYGDDRQVNYGSNSSPVTQKVTVGSVTKTFDFDLAAYNWGQSYMHSNGSFAQAYQNANGTLANGERVWVSHSVYSYAQDFLDSVSFSQNLNYQPTADDSGYASFGMGNGYGYSTVYFNGAKPTTLTINNQLAPAAPVDVPEPAPLALFGLGLIALAVARSKKA